MPRGAPTATLDDGRGTVVEITVNWDYMRDIARKARDSKRVAARRWGRASDRCGAVMNTAGETTRQKLLVARLSARTVSFERRIIAFAWTRDNRERPA